jgi:uncharacterized protein DUF3501
MEKLKRQNIININEYEMVRPEYRERIIAMKRNRRVHAGDQITFVFENRETVKFQIQEMMRIGKLAREEDIQKEIDDYNYLIPSENELSATMMIEITEPESIIFEMEKLTGLSDHVYLTIDDEHRVKGEFDDSQKCGEHISTVLYVRFKLTPDQVVAFKDKNKRVLIDINHTNYRDQVELPEYVRDSLIPELPDYVTALP